MILVDSSVWVEYFKHPDSAISAHLDTLITPAHQTASTGIIIQEVLQGIRDPASRQVVWNLFSKLPILQPSLETHLQAAKLFQTLSQKGYSTSSVDILIASLCMEYRCSLFTLDKAFEKIAEHSSLKLHRT